MLMGRKRESNKKDRFMGIWVFFGKDGLKRVHTWKCFGVFNSVLFFIINYSRKRVFFNTYSFFYYYYSDSSFLFFNTREGCGMENDRSVAQVVSLYRAVYKTK